VLLAFAVVVRPVNKLGSSGVDALSLLVVRAAVAHADALLQVYLIKGFNTITHLARARTGTSL